MDRHRNTKSLFVQQTLHPRLIAQSKISLLNNTNNSKYIFYFYLSQFLLK